MSKPYVIGVLGGMGTYATIDLFERYAERFPAEKEWDRPRIIIDNYCTMPSRVRAYLYQERKEELVEDMTNAITELLHSGCSRVVLACNTSHLYLPDIYERIPDAKGKILNIIDLCVEQCRAESRTKVYLLASEGTIDSGVYHERLDRYGIQCLAPSKQDFSSLRECIEAVKCQDYNVRVNDLFCSLMNNASKLHADAVLLGCTELPILYNRLKDQIDKDVPVYDPIDLALDFMYREYQKNENKNRKGKFNE